LKKLVVLDGFRLLLETKRNHLVDPKALDKPLRAAKNNKIKLNKKRRLRRF
jgi:hypothetical protein